MDVGYIILGRSWLYDLDVTVYGRSNFCSFVHDRKKVKLTPMRHIPLSDTKRHDASSSKKVLNLISLKSVDKESKKPFTMLSWCEFEELKSYFIHCRVCISWFNE